jgi:dihydrofolate reductase
MSKLRFDISMSLDGFITGPDPRPGQGLGAGGEQLHEWAFPTDTFRETHGGSGGERNVDSEILDEIIRAAGAHIMGKGMFGGGAGPWDDADPVWGDKPWEGWWGDEPPFHKPVFVLTHHAREPLVKGETTFTFVTDGIESALAQARAAAGDKDVAVAGGASVAQQYLKAGLLDEFQVTVAPVLLGSGTRLFDGLPPDVTLEQTRVVESPSGVTHLRYRVVR